MPAPWNFRQEEEAPLLLNKETYSTGELLPAFNFPGLFAVSFGGFLSPVTPAMLFILRPE